MTFTVRKASSADVPSLNSLIHLSVRELQRHDYTPAQIEGALQTVFGVDTALITDGTYFAVESQSTVVACGGWSMRKTLFGGDHWTARDDLYLDPATDAAKIRAFFVHPDWSRRGLGTLLLTTCEDAAKLHGFTRFEMGATLTGVPLYRARGYTEAESLQVPLANGEHLPVIRMTKKLS